MHKLKKHPKRTMMLKALTTNFSTYFVWDPLLQIMILENYNCLFILSMLSSTILDHSRCVKIKLFNSATLRKVLSLTMLLRQALH